MYVKINGSANMREAVAEFAALEKQVASLNAEMFKSTVIPGRVNPAGYERMQRALDAGSKTFRNALASSGRYHVEQLKINSATETYTDLLQRQKLSLFDIVKKQKLLKAAYREQLALQQMIVRETPSGVSEGRRTYDIAVPTEVSKELDTIRNRMGWVRAEIASASQQTINWGKNTQWAGRQLMVGFTMPVAAFGAATGVLAYQVDKNMTRIQKVYDTTANANNMSLRSQMAVEKELAAVRMDAMDTARLSAKEYGASLTDTLDIQAQLAATGLKGAELQKTTSEVMRVATLGEFDHQTAMEASIALQSIMGYTAAETAQQFDYLNSVENATSLATEDFAKAIPIALGPLKEMGGDVQDLGVLLTAMKERGIEAGEGANAIKAMMQRLYRPSKQIREEWEKLTNTDITQIRNKNKGNIMGMLEDIERATRNLNRPQRVQALGGLIGTYQVSRINAVLGGLRDMQEGIGQTSSVMKINQQTSKEWADVADREMERWQKSVSGRFKSALETLKVELAEMGKPFLEVATAALQFTTNLAEGFNSMPGWAKKAAIITGIIMAFVGPIVMLIGLFANFAGNIGKFIATLIGLGTRFNIVTKESRAAELAAKLTEAGFISEAKAAQLLTVEINALSRSLDAANVASKRVISNQPLFTDVALGMHGPAKPTNKQWAEMYYADTSKRDAKGKFRSNAERMREAEMRLAQEHADDLLKTQNKISNNVSAEAKIREKISGSMSGAAVAGATMAASSAVMMTTSNETANNIAQWALMASIIGPALKGLASPMKLMSAKTTSVLGTMSSVLSVNVKNAAVTAKTAGVLGTMRSMFSGILGLLTSSVGKMGLIGMGIAAVVWGIKKVYDHQQDIKAERERLIKQEVDGAKALADASELWAENAGETVRQLREIKRADLLSVQPTGMDSLIAKYQDDAMKDFMDKFKSMDAIDPNAGEDFRTSGQYQEATRRFWELQNENGLTAKQAAVEIEAMYMAAGRGALEANMASKELLHGIGDVRKMSSETATEVLRIMTNLARPSGTDAGQLEAMKVNAQSLAAAFFHEFDRAAAGYDAQRLLAPLKEGVSAEWEDAFGNMSDDQIQALASVGIRNAEMLRKVLTDYMAGEGSAQKIVDDLIQQNKDLFFPGNGEVNTFEDLFIKPSQGAIEFERTLIGLIATGSDLKGEFTSLEDVFSQGLINSKVVPVTKMMIEQLKAEAAAIRVIQAAPILSGKTDAEAETMWAQKLLEINQILVSNNLPQAKNLHQALLTLMKFESGELDKQGGKMDGLASKARTLGGALQNAFNFSKRDWGSMLQSGFSGVQQDIADAYRSDFDTRMNNALESRQRYWDNRASQLSAEMDRRESGLDARWERRTAAVEAYYDKRIKAVENTIKAEQRAEDVRQRIFDAEMQRLDRLRDAQNRNIDFNVALNSGDFDEAAKIRNDAASQETGWALADQRAKEQRRSERKVGKLENRRDSLEEQRQRELEMMRKREEAERKHLEKIRRMREAALQKQTEADMEANREEWEQRKKNMEDKLELFLAYIATNEKDLKKHMERVGLEYDDFGEILQKKGDTWATFFQDSLTAHIREAGLKIANDKLWDSVGATMAKKLLHGALGMSQGQFMSWMKSGKFPSGVSFPGKVESRHEGGVVGDGLGSRKGVARSQQGMHGSEKMIRAQVGEYVVNRKSAAQNKQLLDAINSGSSRLATGAGGNIYSGALRNIGTGAIQSVPTGGVGLAGVMTAVAASMIQGGISTGIVERANEKIREMMAQMSGTWSMANVGKYGDMFFDKTQLKNAKIIADVGSALKMSKRDISIGIMTAITESGLRNVDYGDRDSLGLFQQRPSQGWGTPAQVTDPVYAATQFFQHLKMVGGRNGMSPWAAAQAVQRSAFSSGSNYAQHWDEAQAIIGAMTPVPAGFGGLGGRHYNVGPVKPWVQEAADYLGNKYHIGTIFGYGSRGNVTEHDDGRALDFMTNNVAVGNALAAEVIARNKLFDAMYVIYRQRINSFDGRGWRAMEDRGSATANHMDHVHVSFDPTGDVDGLMRTGRGQDGVGDGSGGWHKPVAHGRFSNSHDIPVGFKTPVYAVNDGKIIESRAITSGGSPQQSGSWPKIAPNGQPYRSYGETIVLHTAGSNVRYAHMWPGTRRGKGSVRGGTMIGRSAATGNASGPHLHMDIGGSYIAQSWLANHGVSLAKGAENIRFDNTLANLHKNETVLTEDLSAKFKQGVDNFANGGGNVYNLNVYSEGPMSPQELARYTIKELKRLEDRKPRARK